MTYGNVCSTLHGWRTLGITGHELTSYSMLSYCHIGPRYFHICVCATSIFLTKRCDPTQARECAGVHSRVCIFLFRPLSGISWLHYVAFPHHHHPLSILSKYGNLISVIFFMVLTAYFRFIFPINPNYKNPMPLFALNANCFEFA